MQDTTTEQQELPFLMLAMQRGGSAEALNAARHIGPALLTWLEEAGRWETLPDYEQAAVYWAMASSCQLQHSSTPGDALVRDTVKQLLGLADELTHTTPARYRDSGGRASAEMGVRLAARLASLPYGWRVEATRRMLTGTPFLDAIGEAETNINLLRSVWGIDVRDQGVQQ
ncbi:hypothetical protein [Streptomyces sp. NPDC048644]|uniref:hypothetical protein n=1 Tax=Streptomyces sp. NPDC048644 TaxID=3365582 RepID=UPI0037169228